METEGTGGASLAPGRGRRLYWHLMDKKTFREFSGLRERLGADIARWTASSRGLAEAQAAISAKTGRTPYPIETPIVYNSRMDEVGPASDVRYLIVADNPGIREQEAANRRYLVGQSGKLARSFFASHREELGADFDTGTLILNKTPIHTPRTAELALLKERFGTLLEETQTAMADYCFEFHRALGCELWIVGYGELGPRKLFAPFTKRLKERYLAPDGRKLAELVFVFRHFSMNQFSIDLAANGKGDEGVKAGLEAIGRAHRLDHLGW
jgi:hypothetical protein